MRRIIEAIRACRVVHNEKEKKMEKKKSEIIIQGILSVEVADTIPVKEVKVDRRRKSYNECATLIQIIFDSEKFLCCTEKDGHIKIKNLEGK